MVVEWFAGAAIVVLTGIALDLVSEEARGWLDLVPRGILRFAALRLPEGQRGAIYEDEWLPELDYILRGAEARPVTRLIKGTMFSVGLLFVAKRIASYRAAATTQPASEREPVLALTTDGESDPVLVLTADRQSEPVPALTADGQSEPKPAVARSSDWLVLAARSSDRLILGAFITMLALVVVYTSRHAFSSSALAGTALIGAALAAGLLVGAGRVQGLRGTLERIVTPEVT
jgi:hypothetical protein